MAFTWSDTAVPTSGGLDLRDFAEDTGHGILCAIGGTGLVYTTPDAVTYTQRTLAENNNMRGIAYAPTLGTAGRLCAVSINGVNRIQTSDDGGQTWAAQGTPEANQWNVIRWVPWLNSGNGLYVAIASTGTHRCMTSPTGLSGTWTLQTIASAKGWTGLAVSATTLVIVCFNSGTQQAANSTDTITWTLQTTSGSAANQIGVAGGSSALDYSPTLQMFAYVAVGAGARFINTSIDNGVTWVAVALPTNRTWTGIRWFVAGLRWIIPSQSVGTFVAESTDGATFTESSTGITNRFWDCVGCFEAVRTVVSWGQSVNTHMLTGVWAVPAVTSVSPSFGTHLGGTVVTLTGTGFTGATSVTFCGTAAVSVVVTSDTSITCVTPPHAGGTCDVTVVGKATLTNGYTFVAVTRVSPKAGTVAGGTAVTITGVGFAAASSVLFGAVAATSIVVISDTSMTAVTPAHASGVVDVTVVGVDTGAHLYTYTLAVPQTLGKGLLLPPINFIRHVGTT